MSSSRRSTTIDSVVKHLAPDFADLPEATVRDAVSLEYDALMATRVRIYAYISNLVEHEARERLRAKTGDVENARRPRTA